MVQAMSEAEFQPRSLALHLGASFAVLAACFSFFWFNRADNEAQIVEPPPGWITPELAERKSADLPPQANQIAWGFSDRWFPLIQVVKPSVPAVGQSSTEVAAMPQLVPTPSEERRTYEPDDQVQSRIPLPRRRPVLAEEPGVPLPRSRPNGPAPQSVFIAVGTTDDRYPSP